MFGVALRTAAAWAGAILGSAILSEIIGEYVAPLLVRDTLLFRSLTGVSKWAPLIITIAAVLKIIARGLAERQVAR
jgi:hypothetical protein